MIVSQMKEDNENRTLSNEYKILKFILYLHVNYFVSPIVIKTYNPYPTTTTLKYLYIYFIET